MKRKIFYSHKSRFSAVFLLVFVFAQLISVFPANVFAVEAGESYIRCDRMKAAFDPGDCLVVFTTSSTAFAEAYIKVTLDAEWVSTTNFSTTAGNYTVSTSGLPAGVTAMPGVATADQVSSQTIRFPITALANSTTYGFYITGTGLILNPSASTSIIHTIFTRDSGDATTGDTKDVAVPVISDDQITVNASIGPSFTFVFNNNSQSLGNLTSGSITSGGGTTITINTNATNGWYAWAKDSNAGLYSANALKTIATAGTLNDAPSTISAGTEGYVLDVDETTDAPSGGDVTIADEYNGTTTSQGGTTSTTLQLIASADGTANGDVITLIPRVAVSATTPAASDYTDTFTVVGAGAF
jgi:hypothetical protein